MQHYEIVAVHGGAVLRFDLHHHHPHFMGWCGVAERGNRSAGGARL